MPSFAAYPLLPVSATIPRPGMSYGTFTLAGANPPTSLSGAIESVRRLEVGGDPFFRVRFSHGIGRVSGTRALESYLTGTVHDPAGETIAVASEGNLVDDGGDVRDDLRELDISVIGAAGKIDTTGFRVDLLYVFSQSPRK